MTAIDSFPPFVPLDSEPGELGRVTRADVIAEARSWLDTPFMHQHRAKGHGVDCAGLVVGVARELQIVPRDFDVNGYPREPDGKALLALCDRFMKRVPMRDLKPGQVLVFAVSKYPGHLGIVGDYLHGGLSIIQALANPNGKGSVIESRFDAMRHGWRPVQAYALPGVED